MKRSNYECYFITIYVCKRKTKIEELMNVANIALNTLRNVIIEAYYALSLSSRNNSLRHPHVHILLRASKKVSYRFFLFNLTRKLKRRVNVRISKVYNIDGLKRYIFKHRYVYIYTRRGEIR